MTRTLTAEQIVADIGGRHRIVRKGDSHIALIHESWRSWTALDESSGVASYGSTQREAYRMLAEALSLWSETMLVKRE